MIDFGISRMPVALSDAAVTFFEHIPVYSVALAVSISLRKAET
jgi:hypothetical protein